MLEEKRERESEKFVERKDDVEFVDAHGSPISFQPDAAQSLWPTSSRHFFMLQRA